MTLTSHATAPPLFQRPAIVSIMACSALISTGTMLFWLVLFGRYYMNAATAAGAPAYLKYYLGSYWLYVAVLPVQAYGWLKAKRWALPFFCLCIVLQLGNGIAAHFSNLAPWPTLLIPLPITAIIIYLLTREPARQYFRTGLPVPQPLPRLESLRYKVRSILYVVASVYLVWTFNGLLLGLPEIYPATYQRDKMGFIALPVLLLAEGLGAAPGALNRLFNLCCAFALPIVETALVTWAISTVPLQRTQLQLVNWAIGLSFLTAWLFYLKRRQEQAQQRTHEVGADQERE